VLLLLLLLLLLLQAVAAAALFLAFEAIQPVIYKTSQQLPVILCIPWPMAGALHYLLSRPSH
jgi:hypothetical protein